VRIGLLARSENRGLGIQSLEFFRRLPVNDVLIVDMGELARGFARHDERYLNVASERGGVTVGVAEYRNGFFVDEALVRDWLHGLDVVFSVETLYDPRFHLWANEARVATVIQLNPEFIKPDVFEPTAWWAPTTWRLDQLPAGTRLVPVPVSLDRFTVGAQVPDDQPMRVLHVVGHRAASDRNGTQLFQQSLRYLQHQIHARIITQDERLLPFRPRPKATCEVVLNGVVDYWSLYENADVLVLPRRYGGLSLVVQEAAASGLALVLTDCSPNETWPSLRVRARPRGGLRAPVGHVQLWECMPRTLAETIDRLSEDRVLLKEQREAARAWADDHSWERLAPLYMKELARAANLAAG
jgi:glycosyltransferase involved in cell wall biosynthesis